MNLAVAEASGSHLSKMTAIAWSQELNVNRPRLAKHWSSTFNIDGVVFSRLLPHNFFKSVD